MELELGLKLNRVADEFNSDFQIGIDRSGPVFMSRETDTMFVLTAHLKGYRRRNIKIDINEDGTLIVISGEKQVKETVMVGWQVYKKDAEIKGFKKVFRIPDGVILDKIKAKFNEDESMLTITMPKKVKGICGTSIEEIKEKPELVKEGSGSLQIADEKIQTTVDNNEQSKARKGEDDADVQRPSEDVQKDHDFKGQQQEVHEEHQNVETEMPKEEVKNQEIANDSLGKTEPQQDVNQLPKQDQQENKDQNDIHEEEKEGHFTDEPSEEALEAEPGKEHEGEHKPREKRCKMCIPIVAGSTLLLSFVVFVIQMMRNKNQTSRRKD
ncbi:hypothetical protein CDL12_24557 [Handroanthus impetiginosus]|uniref:SHSP domain-containing protein n=1 Tax=Handroanthus impetiginosus TaxID=429701 RepID=A0A2G9GCA2_9LAMI|nr:hypothetical protein CDL12_24557 [Handroanthus impetiginosus]